MNDMSGQSGHPDQTQIAKLFAIISNCKMYLYEISNCEMYFPQIVKRICLTLWNVFVSDYETYLLQLPNVFLWNCEMYFYKLWNILFSNCEMYLSQIAKCVQYC